MPFVNASQLHKNKSERLINDVRAELGERTLGAKPWRSLSDHEMLGASIPSMASRSSGISMFIIMEPIISLSSTTN